MKRMTVLAALLLALTLAGAWILPWGLPSEKAEIGPAQMADGAVLAAENRLFTSRIYTLRDGQISALYEESRLRDGRESRLTQITANGDTAVFLREFDGGEWELVRLENEQASLLHHGALEEPGTITGLQVKNNDCWITAIGENGAIFIYRWTEAEDTSLELLIPAWWLRDAVTAEYDGSVIRAVTAYDDHCILTPTGDSTYVQAGEKAELTLPSTGYGRLLCKRTLLLSALALWAAAAVILLGTTLLCSRMARLAGRLTAIAAAALLLALLAAEGLILWTTRDDLVRMWQIARPAGAAMAAVWVCAVALLWWITGRLTAPAAVLVAQMDRMADGDTTPREPLEGRDELSRMDHALQMLCMNLSVMEYESAGTIRSYQRFVPEKMAELLERPVAEEIRLGDSRRLTGNVGVFSIGNRAEARNALEDAAFVDFINHGFGVFHDSVEDNHGCMVSSGLRLSSMEALFPDSAADGVHAGLDFLGKLREGDMALAPQASLLLHKASFLYGVVGREERLFPYLSSSELDLLSSFLPELNQAGVQIAATEAYWSQLDHAGFTGRYIGFVSGGDRLGSYKLYEILDALPQMERDLRKSYDARFQEAINLFYRNDFYLARNLFSTLLRVCPGDGIARWYLFACEYLFHQERAEADYSLFGMKE